MSDNMSRTDWVVVFSDDGEVTTEFTNEQKGAALDLWNEHREDLECAHGEDEHNLLECDWIERQRIVTTDKFGGGRFRVLTVQLLSEGAETTLQLWERLPA